MLFQKLKTKLKEKRVLWSVAASVLLILATGIFCVLFFFPKTEKIQGVLVPAQATLPPDIIVDVKGNVVHPGVYTLPAGSRVQDAVEMAGGFLSETDQENTNLAKQLKDGESITIGKHKINLNTATQEELESLPQIGSTLAKRIILYREQHSDFTSIEELMQVPGIGQGKFEILKDYITV